MLIGIILLLALIVFVVIWLLVEYRRNTAALMGKFSSEQSLVLIQQQMAQVRDTLNMQLEFVRQQLNDSKTAVTERMSSASNLFGEIKKEIGGLNQASEQMLAVGRDISTLQELLRSPKLRGGLGEYFLGQMLRQILPQEHFTEQHRFSSGDTVDAVIRMGNKLLPIDAKFPLENFKKMMEASGEDEKQGSRKLFISDVKRHLQSIAEKYIVPDEGTFDFAFMYIPAENVYYEIIAGEDIYQDVFNKALEKKVFPVSPSSLFAYLQIILLGLKGLVVERNVQVILDRMARLRTDIGRFTEDFSLIGKHLGNTRSKYEDADKRLNRLTEKISDLDKS